LDKTKALKVLPGALPDLRGSVQIAENEKAEYDEMPDEH
jgi:hypothetical protein